jgi:hypothetical protein
MFDRSTTDAIVAAARRSGIEPATLLAVCEVESGGRVFTKVNGRDEPLIRFEGHYFYRLLPAALRNRAVIRGLAHHQAGRIPNPWRQAGRWRLLEKASAIDRTAALQSTSWGIGQVMGIHWQWLGYASLDAMVGGARSGAAGQVELMVRYIERSGLMAALREGDWAGFARGYNGPGYAKHGYHLKLAAAQARHGGSAMTRSPRRNQAYQLRLGSAGPGVASLQAALAQAGYPVAIDADFGPATEAALKSFQITAGLAPDGTAGPATFEALARRLPQPANLLG